MDNSFSFNPLLVSLMNERIFGKSYLDNSSFERLKEGLLKRSPKN